VNNGNGFEKRQETLKIGSEILNTLSPAWMAFIRYCRQFQHGEIERLRIQDGQPLLAELAVKKVKFAP
jgi:hypothetical protein